MKRYALSAGGRDRPGIVAAVTKALYEHDCNIEDSTMTILEDEFAIILIMTMPDKADLNSLLKDIRKAEKEMGLAINIKEIPPRAKPSAQGSNYIITLHGADRAGIVYRTAKLLSDMGINITDLETKAVQGEEEKVYIMVLEVYAPKDILIKRLEEEFKELEKTLGVTIKIKPIEAFEP